MPIQTIIVRLATPISSGAVHAIDLGLVSLRDAAINVNTRTVLIPYADGRLISSVRFVPGGSFASNPHSLAFLTPNTTDGSGYGFAELSEGIDTLGLIAEGDQTSIGGDNSKPSQILDCGPLVLALANLPMSPWSAATVFCIVDSLIDPNGHLQQVSVNGVSGSTEPTWNDSGGTTSDGTVTWQDVGLVDGGTVHVIVEVIEGVSPMPPYPASFEFIAQPQNTVAGQTMPDVTVIVKDQNGQPYMFQPTLVSLAIYGVGTLSGTTSVRTDKSTGIATFNDLSISEAATGYIMRATNSQSIFLDPIFSDPFDVTAP